MDTLDLGPYPHWPCFDGQVMIILAQLDLSRKASESVVFTGLVLIEKQSGSGRKQYDKTIQTSHTSPSSVRCQHQAQIIYCRTKEKNSCLCCP
jgi:hypothetical protein